MSDGARRPADREAASKGTSRTARYRQRMRAAGFRPVQIWVPDTRSPEFKEVCRQQSEAIARGDPAGDEVLEFVAHVYEWPED